MKNNIFEEIQNWFESGKDLKQGMKLHTTHSKNFNNKKLLAKTILNKSKLLERLLLELLNQNRPANVEKIKIKKPQFEEKRLVFKENIATRLKKEFPKIDFKDLPDKLKLLVFKRYDAWEKSVKAHAAMHKSETNEDRRTAVFECVENIEKNWRIWDELNEFHKTGKTLNLFPELKEELFDNHIKQLEQLSAEQYTKEFTVILRRTKNNLFAFLKRKNNTVPYESKETYDLNVYKHDVVARKLNEPLWKIE